ncbi:hypothetical protein H257_09315 [Aphanomyces astaci]|uniref:Uncharacterized protein n=1 Tax=Aphanomyces astaci TaxID=112090 RepID=W4GB11_APHAT|nr:hypothetical protein H257_09315 [Aphanomyces astaci]ETV76877.1 hypothetical protein H257_09315 [Aphanomyces astaci]|eukprot:XP_009833789.1 hypothetical protein H257_09315 [Aphanomyces astaci]
MAFVLAKTTWVESDFSILKWEKDEFLMNLLDLSLEGIFQAKQFKLLGPTQCPKQTMMMMTTRRDVVEVEGVSGRKRKSRSDIIPEDLLRRHQHSPQLLYMDLLNSSIEDEVEKNFIDCEAIIADLFFRDDDNDEDSGDQVHVVKHTKCNNARTPRTTTVMPEAMLVWAAGVGRGIWSPAADFIHQACRGGSRVGVGCGSWPLEMVAPAQG